MNKQIAGVMETQGAKVGAVLCSTSYLEGGNWGYLMDTHNDYKTLLGIMEQERALITLTKVSNGVLVLADEGYLHNSVASLMTQQERDIATRNRQARKQTEKKHCLKFLESIVKNETKYGTAYDGFKEFAIGLYSSNSNNKIQVNGIEYPAFKITLPEVMEYLAQLQRFRKVYVKTVNAGVVEFKSITDIEGFSSIAKGLEISATQTGVFLIIRVQ